jgi:hypothetical protein
MRHAVRPFLPFALAAVAALPATTLLARGAQAQAGGAAAVPTAGPARLVGEWVLDTARSTKGPGMPPSLTLHVRQSGPSLVVRRMAETPAGPMDVTFTYALDGSPSVNRTQQGGAEIVVTSTVKQEGGVLTLDSQIQTPEQAVHQVDRFTVAPDGGELTVARALSVGEQAMQMTFVFRRRAG